MRTFTYLLLLLPLAACRPGHEQTPVSTTNAKQSLTIDWSEQPDWEKDGLRLVPIKASDDFIAAQADVAQYKVLREALHEERFRVTEKKPFGRFSDAGAVNTLTVQNKTNETVFLMEGEIVRGGNQDRVIARDLVVPPRTIADVPVFCVEQDRWSYEPQEESVSEADRKVFAFRGYYHVASGAVRRSISTGSQEAVWEQVALLTSRHGTSGSTAAYAGLENSEEFVDKRSAYERFFADKLADNEEIVGFIALYKGTVIGADLFGHPDLLNRQYPGLLAGYITDAVSDVTPARDAPARAFGQEFIDLALAAKNENGGAMVHFARLQ